MKGMRPLGKTGNEIYDKSIRAKIKGSSSPRRKLAQQISAIKRMKPETIEKRCLELATNPQRTALEIMQFYNAIKKRKGLKPETEIQLLKALNDAFRTLFGTRNFIALEKTNYDEFANRIKEFEEKKMLNMKKDGLD